MAKPKQTNHTKYELLYYRSFWIRHISREHALSQLCCQTSLTSHFILHFLATFISPKQKIYLLIPSFACVFPCCAPHSTQSLPPPLCPKSSEGHPGAQEVAIMSANEPIDNLSTGWLVLQALTMCITENFLAQATSLLDLCPAMPSIFA